MNEEPATSIPDEDFTQVKPKSKRLILFIIISLLALCAIPNWYIKSTNRPPTDFPTQEHITIEPGTSVRDITEILEEKNVVKSKDFLYYSLLLFYEPTNIKASIYVFEEPVTTQEVAKRLTEGDFDTDLIRFTHIEGERASQLAIRAEQILPNFSAEEFMLRADTEQIEGKLFPETYFIPASFDETELLDLLVTTFNEKISSLVKQIETHSLPLEEILVLASIIEREANSLESMRLVSGILQNRIEIGMPLQADASIEYILDKPLAELTPEDLEIDSPYNTYLNIGLPPTPIGNPGLDAIIAVLEPTESDYFYYITDEEGEFHYAKTYKEHLINIEKYLR